MTEKVCAACGELFIPTSRRVKYCDRQHYRKCEVCGELFPISKDKLVTKVKTCSEKCRRASISSTFKQSKQMLTLTCQECGEIYHSQSRYPPICSKKHFRTCPVCNKLFEITPRQIVSHTQTCSKECRYALTRSTLQTNWGVDNPAKSEELKSRYRQSMLDKYGVDNPMKSESIKMKAQNTVRERYGASSFTQTEEYRIKSMQTNQARYGADWYSQTQEHKDAVRATCLAKYGTTNPSKSADIVKLLVSDDSKIDMWEKFHADRQKFIDEHFPQSKPTLTQLSESCGIRDSSVGAIISNAHCQDLIQYGHSKIEDEIKSFLTTLLGDSLRIVSRTKKIITPYELDLYFPDYSIAIECNPTCTHNSSVPDPWESPLKHYKYHQMKSDLCEAKNIQLFHVFGSEWTHKSEIVKSMLRNLFKANDRIIYARSTEVRSLDTFSCRRFLSENHRQGSTDSSIRLGLFLPETDELVAVMTFGKMRNSIGTSTLEDSSDCYELVRFCNALNTSVVGGASKLFKYFVRHYHPNRIRSFSDRAHTSGKLYQTLGFSEVRRSDPGYVWVDLKTDISYHRANAQKRNLKTFLHDDNIDLTATETEIMINHGFVQMFDSGTILWEWSSNN